MSAVLTVVLAVVDHHLPLVVGILDRAGVIDRLYITFGAAVVGYLIAVLIAFAVVVQWSSPSGPAGTSDEAVAAAGIAPESRGLGRCPRCAAAGCLDSKAAAPVGLVSVTGPPSQAWSGYGRQVP